MGTPCARPPQSLRPERNRVWVVILHSVHPSSAYFARPRTCSKWLQVFSLLLTKPSGGSCHADISAGAPLAKGQFPPPVTTAP